MVWGRVEREGEGVNRGSILHCHACKRLKKIGGETILFGPGNKVKKLLSVLCLELFKGKF